MTMFLTVPELAAAVLASMDKQGWRHGHSGDRNGPLCVGGHISLILRPKDQWDYFSITSDSYQGQVRAMAQALGVKSLPDWNDTHGEDQVREALKALL